MKRLSEHLFGDAEKTPEGNFANGAHNVFVGYGIALLAVAFLAVLIYVAQVGGIR